MVDGPRLRQGKRWSDEKRKVPGAENRALINGYYPCLLLPAC